MSTAEGVHEPDYQAIARQADATEDRHRRAQAAAMPPGSNQSGVTRLLDGPGRGATLLLRRAPIYLRITIEDTLTDRGKVDALDQEDDEPAANESVHVYQRVGQTGVVYLRPGGRYQGADYEHRPDLETPQIRSREGFIESVRQIEGLDQ